MAILAKLLLLVLNARIISESLLLLLWLLNSLSGLFQVGNGFSGHCGLGSLVFVDDL
jgi:hypothetical protein